MGTHENTISMLEVLPETDLLEFLKPMSREDFMKDIEIAEQEVASGKYRSAEEVFDGLERRYGL